MQPNHTNAKVLRAMEEDISHKLDNDHDIHDDGDNNKDDDNKNSDDGDSNAVMEDINAVETSSSYLMRHEETSQWLKLNTIVLNPPTHYVFDPAIMVACVNLKTITTY